MTKRAAAAALLEEGERGGSKKTIQIPYEIREKYQMLKNNLEDKLREFRPKETISKEDINKVKNPSGRRVPLQDKLFGKSCDLFDPVQELLNFAKDHLDHVRNIQKEEKSYADHYRPEQFDHLQFQLYLDKIKRGGNEPKFTLGGGNFSKRDALPDMEYSLNYLSKKNDDRWKSTAIVYSRPRGNLEHLKLIFSINLEKLGSPTTPVECLTSPIPSPLIHPAILTIQDPPPTSSEGDQAQVPNADLETQPPSELNDHPLIPFEWETDLTISSSQNQDPLPPVTWQPELTEHFEFNDYRDDLYVTGLLRIWNCLLLSFEFTYLLGFTLKCIIGVLFCLICPSVWTFESENGGQSTISIEHRKRERASASSTRFDFFIGHYISTLFV